MFCDIQISCLSASSTRNDVDLLGKKKSLLQRGVVEKQLTCKLVILPCGLSPEDIHEQSAHEIHRHTVNKERHGAYNC